MSENITTRIRKKNLRKTTVSIVAGRGCVAGTVALASRFDPDDGVDKRRPSVKSGACAESCTEDIAPVTPLITDALHTRTALVDDEVSGESIHERSESLDVVHLIVVVIARRDGVRGRGACRKSGLLVSQ